VASKFRAILQGVHGSSATFVLVPQRIMKGFGGRVRVPVRMTINGVEHRTTICNMGLGPTLGIPAPMRQAAGIDRGARVTVILEVDDRKRTVKVPRDFASAMNAAQRRLFDHFSYSHRKEWVVWIEDAKRPETRARRIEKARAKLDSML
jgi:bacteriocin resistance YdeI/OmpD-like protein/uncharacterized protein DUF1905